MGRSHNLKPKWPKPKWPKPPLLGVWLGLAVLFCVAAGLRFWGIGRFNTLVFDEIYYANFAAAFLRGEQEFGGHPPLSTYVIALGIWLGEWLGFGDATTRNTLTGLSLSTVSYRWINALIGAFFPVLVGAIALQLTRRSTYALLAAFLATLDGLFLVESRYALNNIYLVLLGLVGWLCWLLALNHLRPLPPLATAIDGAPVVPPQPWKLWLWLGLAGVGFGGAIAIKWNGAGFLLGAILLWAIAWAGRIVRHSLEIPPTGDSLTASPLAFLPKLHVGHLAVSLGFVPALTYWLSWLPYMALDNAHSFWGWQAQVLSYHQRVGGSDAHPYCSQWDSWPLMGRPIAYFYETVQSGAPRPETLTETPPSHLSTAIYDVHAIGNPLLWWLASIGSFALLWVLVMRVGAWLRAFQARSGILEAKRPYRPWATVSLSRLPTGLENWTILFLLVNWGANWLPWAKVSRCTFLYHYMSASVFALLAIALWLEQGLHSPNIRYRQLSIAALLLIGFAFLFWLPLFLGLPLSPEGILIRRWLPSWT